MPSSEWWALQKERREKQKELMAEWERAYYYPKLKELQDRCEHHYKFSHLGPVGGVWYTCVLCGENQFRDE